MRKIGIDTNILLRLLVDDDAVQREAVTKFGAGIGKTFIGFITVVTLVEIDWALRRKYYFSKRESAAAIQRLVRLRGVEIQSSDAVIRSLRGVETGRGDFADLMIVHLALDANCDHVASLDKKAAAKIAAVELIS